MQWDEWKLDYLKRHLRQKVHVKSVDTFRSQRRGTLKTLLSETREDRENRIELSGKKTILR